MINNQSFSPLLPPLNIKSRVRGGNAGEWHYENAITFDEVAASLLLTELETDTVSISSIPDMWARPLLVEMVLNDQDHPLHLQIKAQWKGMIAAIALAEVQGLKLKAELLNLSQLSDDPFIDLLRKLIPDNEKYTLLQKNPWANIYVFLISFKSGQDIAVGMTSPNTIICPAEDKEWTELPWWSDGRLQSPIEPEDHLNDDEKIQLWHWLKNLLGELEITQGNHSSKIREIIKEFQAELLDNSKLDPNTHNFRRSNRQNFFGVNIDGGVLSALNSPIGAKPVLSSVTLKLRSKLTSVKQSPIIIPDPSHDITKQWNIKSKDIWLHDTTRLVNFNLEEFRKKYKDVLHLTVDELFLSNFYYLKGVNYLPGACLPIGSDLITYRTHDEEHNITPLLPINSKLLNYFTPEELKEEIIELQPVNLSGNRSGVCVRLNLPLSSGNYVVTKNYSIEEENAITVIPFLEVWPNFRAEGWREYYAFYYDDRLAKSQKTFQVLFPDAKERYPIELKDFQITRLEEFPSFIRCQDQSKSTDLGLILLNTPNLVGDKDPNKTWIVGVDFGTSFTNVYYKSNNQAKLLTLSPRHLQITATEGVSRVDKLNEYFMSAAKQELPLSTVLTTNGGKGQDRQIFDGRIYIPEDIHNFDPNRDEIKIDLKWSTHMLPYNRLFLKHLALLISVEAAKNDVKKIEWAISYPSAFSRTEMGNYLGTWQNIIEDLSSKTGIIHQWLPEDQHQKRFCSESLAIAHYFVEEEKEDLVYTTCIDMGGGTSDISIWLGNRLIHQCSVLLAGKNLFSQFITQKTKFLKNQFNLDIFNPGDELETVRSFVKVDAILRRDGKKWLREKRQLFDNDTDLQYIVQSSAIGIAGLYYYVGLILQALHLEEKYTRDQITPVYIGGNGSQILNWLATTGRFDSTCDAYQLFSRMLAKGSGFQDTKEKTVLSSRPKAEVACGLVSQGTKLTGLQHNQDDDVISGEDCYVNGKLIAKHSRFRLDGNIKTCEVKELRNLRNFLDDFHTALIDLKIESIKPLKEYKNKNESDIGRIWKATERLLEAELLKMTGLADDIRVEPPFIIGLKSLLRVLAKR